jgi:hypothetical protein
MIYRAENIHTTHVTTHPHTTSASDTKLEVADKQRLVRGRGTTGRLICRCVGGNADVVRHPAYLASAQQLAAAFRNRNSHAALNAVAAFPLGASEASVGVKGEDDSQTFATGEGKIVSGATDLHLPVNTGIACPLRFAPVDGNQTEITVR